jgi:muramoyltetrapeptide carboxypeptidase
MTHSRPSPDYARPWLAPGARIAVVAPASPFDAASFELGMVRLRDRYLVDHDASILDRRGYFAGDDTRRLRELAAALADDRIDGIIAARGGYGATRLLPHLDVERVRRRPKLLIGFSDITAMHALWARAQVASVHGMMVATLGRAPAPQVSRWFDALEGRFSPCVRGLTTITSGQAEGVLLGGNLTVLTALIGTPYFPRLDGAILFLEDVGERPYRIDRMLTTWRSAGVLAAVRGIALGAFEKAEPGDDGVTAHDVLRERLGDLGIPVVSSVPSGHIDDNLELPLGTSVRLDTESGELRLLVGSAT